MGSRLLENGREIRRAEEADNSLHIRTLRAIVAHSPFEFGVAIGNTNQRGQMSASRITGNDNLLRCYFEFAFVTVQKTDGGF